MRKLAQSFNLSRIFCLLDTFLAENFIYALLWLAEIPAIYFLEPAVSSKNSTWGLVCIFCIMCKF